MAESRHGRFSTSEGIHIAYQWSYADAAARAGATGFEAHHIGKLALQMDTNELYMLSATAPTWIKIGGPDAAIALSDHDHTGDAGDGGELDHGALTGRDDDDHAQYLLADGTRAMSGDLDMGAQAITSVGNVDGVNVSGHAARHDVGGADALSTIPDHDHTGDAGDGAQIGVGALSSVTGSDTSVVTGAAGDDGDMAVWNADGDVVEGNPVSDYTRTAQDETITGAWTFQNLVDLVASAVTALLTINQQGVGDIMDLQDAGTTVVRVPDQGGLQLVGQAGGFQSLTGLIGYDSEKERLVLKHEHHNYPVPLDGRSTHQNIVVAIDYV